MLHSGPVQENSITGGTLLSRWGHGKLLLSRPPPCLESDDLGKGLTRNLNQLRARFVHDA